MEAGWCGVMSLPLELKLLAGGKLGIEPVEELKLLRREQHSFAKLILKPGSGGLPENIQGDSLEIEAVFEPGPTAEFGINLLSSPDGEEQTHLVYDASRQILSLDCTASSLSSAADRNLHEAPLSPDTDGCLKLHIYLDHSVLEVFANGHTCLAGRVYPTRPDSLGMNLFARRGQTGLKSLDIWKMKSIERSLLQPL
jgi:beta-fructofuranosidase